MAIDATGL